MPNIGMGELLIVLAMVLLIFGANRLPQIGEGFGKAIRSFKRGIQGDDDIDVTPKKNRVAPKSSAEDLSADAKDASEAEIIDRKS